MELMRVPCIRPAVAALLAPFAFVAGLLIGAQAADTSMKFVSSLLYDSAFRYHRSSHENIVVLGKSTQKRTFALAASSGQVGILAREYGMDAENLSGIWILRDSLPQGVSGGDRIPALGDWLWRQPGGQILHPRSDQTPYSLCTAERDALVKMLGPGRRPFSSLNADEKEACLAYMRSCQVARQVSGLATVLDTAPSR